MLGEDGIIARVSGAIGRRIGLRLDAQIVIVPVHRGVFRPKLGAGGECLGTSRLKLRWSWRHPPKGAAEHGGRVLVL